MSRLTSLLSILAIAAGALSGCGGDKEKKTAPNGEAKVVQQNARSVITDPGKTCKLLTDKALAVYAGDHGAKDPLGACIRQVNRGRLPKTADIDVFQVKGDVARVAYVTDSVTGVMIFVKQDGDWLMDGVSTVRN